MPPLSRNLRFLKRGLRTDELAGEPACERAVIKRRHSADQRQSHRRGGTDVPIGAPTIVLWHVPDFLFMTPFDFIEVEDDDICNLPGLDQAAIMKTEERRELARQRMNTLLGIVNSFRSRTYSVSSKALSPAPQNILP